VRELTASSTFNTALQPDTRYRDYEAPAVETIHAASTIVAANAPQELADFRAFLIEIATVVADANREGASSAFTPKPAPARPRPSKP
jgi:hypothetical protein